MLTTSSREQGDEQIVHTISLAHHSNNNKSRAFEAHEFNNIYVRHFKRNIEPKHLSPLKNLVI
jgi:hypothetical protein